MTAGIDPEVAPSGPGCEECDEAGGWWVHLRRCAQCGHIGCCDTSPVPARDRALRGDRAPGDAELRAGGGLVLGLQPVRGRRRPPAGRPAEPPRRPAQCRVRPAGCRTTGGTTSTRFSVPGVPVARPAHAMLSPCVVRRASAAHREPRTRPQVVAHRGSSHETAEHTLAAYVKALDEGAEALECDVRLTADGHLVCVHDRDLRRTAATTGLVSTMNLAELDELDFASWKNPWSDLDDEAPERDPERRQGADAAQAAGDGRRLRPARRAGHRDQAPHPLRRAGRASARRDPGRLRLGPGRVAGPGHELLAERGEPGPQAGARARRGDAGREGPPLAGAAPGGRRPTGSSAPGSRSCASTPGWAGTWSRPGARSTCGRSTPPTTCEICLDLGVTAVISDRPAYMLELLGE